MRRHFEVFAADDPDALDGTPLATFQPGTAAEVYIASTQNDTLVTISPPDAASEQDARPVVLRTNGMPLESDDPGFLIPMPDGGHLTININIVTAATVGMMVKEVDL